MGRLCSTRGFSAIQTSELTAFTTVLIPAIPAISILFATPSAKLFTQK
jgi:hypothetical protein